MAIVVNKEPRLYSLGPFGDLQPGTNEISDKAWAEAKKIVVVAGLISSGVLVEKNVESLKDSLKDIKPDEAVLLVKDTLNVALLQKWSDAEPRRKVKDAINEQIAMLVGAAKQAAEEDAKHS
jgi:hypothetical protein